MIPRKLHRVWLGGSEMPAMFADFWNRWKRMHPDWEFRTWSEADVENRKLFDSLTSLSAKSDLLRYEVIRREGGVYVDVDFEPLRPLDTLLEMGFTFFAGWEDENRVCTAIFGAEAGHPAIETLVRDLPAYATKHKNAGPDIQTGPVFFTGRLRSRPDVTLLPPAVFYPVSYWDRDRLGEITTFGGAYAVHHWNRSWMSPEQRAADDAAMGTRIAFLVPRCPDNGPRDRAWAWLRQRWAANFPQAQIAEGHCEPFHRAAAVNAAAALAPSADTYVIIDADSWVGPDAVRDAVASQHPFILPWSKGYHLTRAFTERCLAGDPGAVRLKRSVVTANADGPEYYHWSGCVVVRREAFEAVGGFDERFRGWGFEDTAFVYRIEDTYGKMPPRGDGFLAHLWHPPAPDAGRPSAESLALFNQIRAARGMAPWKQAA